MESENNSNSSHTESLVASRLKSIQNSSLIKLPPSPDSIKKRRSPIFKFEKVLTPKARLSGSETSVSSAVSTFSFPTPNQSDDDFPVYPASCTHTASYPRTIENPDIVKSISVQDLPSISKSSGKYGTLKKRSSNKSTQGSQKRFWTLRRVHSSKQTSADCSTPELCDTLSIDSHSISEYDVASLTESVESYYKSYEDIAIGESADNGLSNSFQPNDSCTHSLSSYGDDLWQEVGDAGGVLQLHGCDISLHISARSKPSIEICESCATMNKPEQARQRKYSTPVLQTQRRLDVRQPMSRKRFASSKPLNSKAPAIKLTDYDCPAVSTAFIDGRLILGLEDSPDSMLLSNNMENSEGNPHKLAQTFVIAGPTVRLDLKDSRVIEARTTLQVNINVALKDESKESDTEMKHENSCVFTCLQSTSHYGPYRELKSCHQFGDSLQVALDKSQLKDSTTQETGNSCHVYVVPVLKQKNHRYSLTSLWECISHKSFHIGIYGPRRTYGRSTWCVSISSSGFNPTLLKVQNDKLTRLTLRLLSSFHFVVHTIQGYKLSVRPSSSSLLVLETDLTNALFTEDEMRTESRINRLFVLNHALPTSAYDRGSRGASSSNRKFIVELKGLSNNRTFKMNCKTPKLKVADYPSTLPQAVVERLAQNEESSVAAVVESKLHDISFQWSMALQDAKLNFHKTTSFPGLNRLICGSRLALSSKANITKHRNNRVQASYILKYQQEEYMPLLSRHTVWTSESGKSKQEWWICYCRHHVGLVRMDTVQVMDFKDLTDWSKTRITVSKLVEALLKPIQHLKSDEEDIFKKLCAKVCDWPRFGAALDFASPFLSGLTSSNALNRGEKISFYIRNYIKYCSASAANKQFHREILKALLYSEHYNLATELIADFCILTVSAEIATQWEELAEVLIGNVKNYTHDVSDSDDEVFWKPAHNFLCFWKERFGDNYKGVIFGLHQALQSLLDSSNVTLQLLIECVAVVRSFDALCQYDTRL